MRILLLILTCAGLAAAQDRLPPEKLFPPWPAIWTSYNTRPKDCHIGVLDATGRMVLVGVENKGDPRTIAARQQITLLVNDKGFWSEPIEVSAPGLVFFPALAVSGRGEVWVAWSEFNDGKWRIKARSWTGGTLGPLEEVSRGEIDLQPALAALPDGSLYAAWEAAAGGHFEIRGSLRRNGAWSPAEKLSRGGDHEFRPALAADSKGLLWLAWDRASLGRYRVFARHRGPAGWSPEIPAFPESMDTRVPQLAPDSSGRMWILASGRLAALDAAGQRYELAVDLPDWKGSPAIHPTGPEFFTIDRKGRFFLFRSVAAQYPFDWLAKPTTPRMAMAMIDSKGLHSSSEIEARLGYASPQVDAAGNVWAMNSNQFLRFNNPFPEAAGEPAVKSASLAQASAAAESRVRRSATWPRGKLQVNGSTLNIYWGELHNHLTEMPTDRLVATWVDRLYLTARARDGLDMVALTDHDWPWVTRSMYYIEQGIAMGLNVPGSFLAFSGFEWSGDSQVRARFGDRTVIFPDGYHDIARITDNAADTAQKLSLGVKRERGIDWPHHIGRTVSPVNPKFLIPETEPVIEMTSDHGVFETYDAKSAVPVPFRTQIQPGTSMQDALAAGKRVGMVGSSDSHSGFSGYPTGMFAVAAKELTQQAILDAIRQRHTWAIRGGEPVFIDFRADGHFIGEEFTSRRPVRLEVRVKGSQPVTRIELVRNNRYIFVRDFSDGALEHALEYQDTEPAPAFYYVRVSHGAKGYAWSSPIWVDPSTSK